MAKRVFVTATNTNVGKTHVTRLLMREAAKHGLRPAAFKPIETGVENGVPRDGSLLLETMRTYNPATHALTIEDIVPYRFELPAAPFVAKKGREISWNRVETSLERVASHCDILFIEGAGGLMVPIDETDFMIDLPVRFDAHTLLVSPSRLGSINDTLLSMEALKTRGIDFTVAVNLHEDRESFFDVTLPYYRSSGLPYYLLPRDLEPLFNTITGR